VSGPPNGTILVPGQKYVWGIQFAPTAGGNVSGTFSVTAPGQTNPTQTCSLVGSGLAPNVAYTFTGIYPVNTLFHHVSLRFGDTATQYFYVQSTGGAPLVFNSITFSGLQASMYTIVHSPQNPLPAGKLDSIGVQFKPFLEGRPDALLTVNTNALNQPLELVDMWGTGKLGHLVISPQMGTVGTGTATGQLQFGAVAMGDSTCLTLSLHNTGTDTVKILKQILTYGDYDFSYTPLSASDLVLPPDASKLVNVCFKPLEQGSRFASIRFYTNIPLEYPSNIDSSQFLIQVSGTGVPYGKLAVTPQTLNDSVILGATASNCKPDTIWNTGSADLTVTSATITGLSKSDFTLSGVTPGTLIPKNSFVVADLCFLTTNRGSEQDTLTVVGQSSDRTMKQYVVLNGIGQQACASIPSTFTLPLTDARGTGFDTCITVTNCGDAAEMFTAAIVKTHDSAAYSVTTAQTTLIAGGSNGQICLHFAPDTIGATTETVTVTSSLSSIAPTTVTIPGTGAGAYIMPSGTAPTTLSGTSQDFTVTLMNSGNWPWTPGAATITGANQSEFTTTGAVTPPTIAAGASGTVTVTFSPTTPGTKMATLTFASAAPLSFDNNLPYPLTADAADPASVSEISKNGFALGASYPNPTTGDASALVTVPQDAKVRITLVRVDGSEVATAFEGMMTTGNHAIALDAKQLPSGTYFYVLQSGDTRLVRSFILAH
jgi:hypothetical protein